MVRKKISKGSKNRLASQYAIKDEECYFYDEKYPLIINAQMKVEKMYVIGDDNEEEMTSFNSLMPRTVRIEFEEKDEKMRNQPFVMDLYTSLSLEELEKRLKKCKTEQDIEDIEKEK